MQQEILRRTYDHYFPVDQYDETISNDKCVIIQLIIHLWSQFQVELISIALNLLGKTPKMRTVVMFVVFNI